MSGFGVLAGGWAARHLCARAPEEAFAKQGGKGEDAGGEQGERGRFRRGSHVCDAARDRVQRALSSAESGDNEGASKICTGDAETTNDEGMEGDGKVVQGVSDVHGEASVASVKTIHSMKEAWARIPECRRSVYTPVDTTSAATRKSSLMS